MAAPEATRASINSVMAHDQGCHYAEHLEVPFVVLSNGEEVWFLDRDTDAMRAISHEVPLVRTSDEVVLLASGKEKSEAAKKRQVAEISFAALERPPTPPALREPSFGAPSTARWPSPHTSPTTRGRRLRSQITQPTSTLSLRRLPDPSGAMSGAGTSY